MQNLEQLGEQLNNLISSKTVIGEPIIVGEVTLVPIIRANLGFAMGGGNNDGIKRGGASGGGGGAQITPVAIIVIRGADVSILPVDKQETGGLGAIIDQLPLVYEKVMAMRKPKSTEDIAVE